ncbi:MAG TPA: RNA polymerase sigma-70 factor [Streptosporangiaceae bacterium]|jgi:RNA polymerase sigma-70 factor (ECF subfamily)|nr:RNA polymerase sigma-70 factor [Streptosporangiaceae bacterium]
MEREPITDRADGADHSTAAAYESLRPLLFSIAYRMVGSVTEAEDIVQEAFLRYHRAVGDRGQPDSPKAYLSAVVTRLSIDQLRSARARRESYVGEWLPEPLLTGPEPLGQRAADPAANAELADSLSMAFLLLLERLTPLERAVFLLHDVFSYGYDETAGVIGRSATTCRQLARRARQHLEAGRPRFDVAARARDELAERFFAAVGNGEMSGLLDLLAADVEVHGDNSGVRPAWRRPIVGREHVARLLAAIGNQLRDVQGSIRPTEINGQPGALVLAPDGSLISVLSIDIADGQVQTVRSVISRAKLRHLGPLADLGNLQPERYHESPGSGRAAAPG